MRFAALVFATLICCSQSAIAHAGNTGPAVEVYVWGQQPTSAATEQSRWAKDLELRPTNTPSDVLRLRPGLIISQHHGGGKGDQILFVALTSPMARTSPFLSMASRSISSAMPMAKAMPIFIG
jgi:hypothetical protein